MSAFGGKADMTVCGSPLSRSLFGAKRTCLFALHMSAFDPKRTLAPLSERWPKSIRCVSDMKHEHDDPILVTGAAGAVGGIGRNLTEYLLARGHKVRALVRREDERAEALRRLGAEVVQGDLTDLASMHRAIEGCQRIYFGMSVSPAYLEATINTAA